MSDEQGADREIGGPEGKGWYSRGYLPHFDSEGATQHVTMHLADSLPRNVLDRLAEQVNVLPPEKRELERRRKVEVWIDAGHGSCVLRDPTMAAMVEGALLHFDGRRYRLIAWVVMPNHVHVLFEPTNGWAMGRILASWKKFTAVRITNYRKAGNSNILLGAQVGPVWHREFLDRYMRDAQHLKDVVKYIHENPVKAGLAAKAEDWQWSSAWRGRRSQTFNHR